MSDNKTPAPPVSPSVIEDLKNIRIMHSQIVESEQLEIMQESVFVENFLPFFLGELTDSEQINFGFTWNAMSGRGTTEVQIVNEYGENLFRTPAFFDTGVVDVSKSNIFNIMKEYGIDKNIHPTSALNKAHMALREDFKKIQRSSPIAEQNTKRWIEIFKRYRTPDQLAALFAKHNGKEAPVVTSTAPAKAKSVTDLGPNFDD